MDAADLRALKKEIRNVQRDQDALEAQLEMLNAEPTEQEQADMELELAELGIAETQFYHERKAREKAEDLEEVHKKMEEATVAMTAATEALAKYLADIEKRDRERLEAAALKKYEEEQAEVRFSSFEDPAI